MADAILALNCGSSSVKFALVGVAGSEPGDRVVAGEVEGIGTSPHLRAENGAGAALADEAMPEGADYEALLDRLLGWIEAHLDGSRLVAVGHRVVHGGRDFTRPVRVTAAAVSALTGLEPLAPLHQPHNVAAIRSIAVLRPGLPQVACFDTAFHHTMPAVAARFAIPRALEAEGIRRFGFHGLSYEHVARSLQRTAPGLAAGRLVVAHLGGGASLCAMADGRSVDTTMGMTPLDGLVMGTRCGAIDPGVPLYLARRRGMAAEAIEHLLYSESGLLGVSGISSDMRDLLASDEPAAREAVELFVFRVARESAALASSLGGIDGLVFTGGIGEHSAPIRAAVCARLAWLGATLDPEANARGEPCVSRPGSAIEIRVVAADEESVIVHHTIATLGLGPGA